MKLSDFEAQLPDKILARGWDYFEQDHIRRVERVGRQEYAAEVRGTHRYNVFVKLAGEVIKQTECDCPYDYGDVCKHIVAVLFYLQRYANDKTRPVAETDLAALLKQTDDKTLRAFVAERLKHDAKLRKSFRQQCDPDFVLDEDEDEFDEEDDYYY